MYIPKHVHLKNRPSAWLGHIPFAYDLVEGLKPNVIVELGSHFGGSYFTFCDSVNDNALSSKCYAVDTWQGEEHAGYYDNSVFEFVERYNEKYENYSTLLRTTFDDSAKNFEDGSIDLIHIDGFHSYEAVKNDFDTWLPKMRPDGMMLFHDIREKKQGFGVHVFWGELEERYQEKCFGFDHSHGLGILSLSDDQSAIERISKLTNVKEDDLKNTYEKKAKTLRLVLKLKRLFS